jgi:hypothetical protein
MKISLNLMTVGAIASCIAIGFSPFGTAAQAQSILLAPNATYTQNFDNLGSTSGTIYNFSTTPTPAATDLPNGWYAVEDGSNANTTYRGWTNNNSPTGDTYSFGTPGESDRALGVNASSNMFPVRFGAQFTIASGSPNIASFLLGYTGEQWFRGSTTAVDKLTFEYSTTATSLTTASGWTAFTGLDYTSNNTGTANTPLDGNDSTNSSVISNQRITLANPLSAGNTFWIRWSAVNVSGTDNGMGVDNFSIVAEPVPEPTTILGGMAALGVGNAVRRKWQKKQQAAV